MTFEELGLSAPLLTAIADAGYSEPTPIQAGAIPHALTGRDVLGIAQTGTGKTASFTLPLIERLSRGRAKARMPRSLIVAPTRELAAQVADNFQTYAKNQKLTMALLIGGVAFQPQVDILNKGADVLIATPGRLLDHFERGGLLLTGVQILVVDEADRMLDMGFIPDLERIFSLTPPRKQTLFFSATMPKEIQSLVAKFLKDPERVEVSRPATTATTVQQYIARCPDKAAKSKRDVLRQAMSRDDVRNGIIFCNRKRDVDIVARSLKRHGFSADAIHGDLDQSERTKTLAAFKDGSLRFLIASDVAARGLDIPNVSHVFNFDVPHHADDYVHRIGRTGRAGKTGEAITIVAPGDEKSLGAIEKLIQSKIDTLDLGGAGAASSGPAGDAEDDRKPARKSSRSRRKPKAEDAPAQDKGQETGQDRAKDAPKDEGKDEGKAPAPDSASGDKADARPASKGGRKTTEKSPEKTSGDSGDRSRGRKRGTRSKDGDDAGEVGFGDHVPAFMLRS